MLTRNPEARFEGTTAVCNPVDIPADAMVCDGTAIYDLMIPLCDQLLVTTVKKEVEGYTFFNSQWLEDFEPAETIEDTDEYSIFSYRRSGCPDV